MELNEIYLYRMTHIDNIEHILKYGITHPTSSNRNPDYVSIGDKSLIDNRTRKKIIITNGEKSGSRFQSVITLGDYIPFYFGVKMPMLYVMQNGGNFVEQATHPKEIIYLACHLTEIVKGNFTYFFSDGHATDRFSTFYDSSKINGLHNIIDWKAVITTYWGGSENLDLKRKKQAEFLILQDISPEYVSGFVCYNETTKDALLKMGIEEDIIKVAPQIYFNL